MYAAPTHGPNAVAAQKRDHKATGFGLCTRYRVFVGEAYMPPGRGAPSRGVCGEIDRIPRFVGRGLDPALHYYF